MDWQTARYDESYPEKIDPLILPLCDALYNAGFEPTGSCCGHGIQWAYVFFKASDYNGHQLAVYIHNRVIKNNYQFYPEITMEVMADGSHQWSLEIKPNCIYYNTPPAEFMEKTIECINILCDIINGYKYGK
jgi:hypothetical protein